ncbi:MAG TPA: ArsC family reductase [Candidatus Acidoferrum sp.]|nr:ArsC family reductase [Candidatus Acidoferrum sp.]
MVTMYGIPNCDTVKKARVWLERHQISYRFHDYKKDGIEAALLKRWCAELGHDQVLNRRGTSWRKLSEAERSDVNAAKAVSLMLANPSLIKRPLLDTGSKLLLGFSEDSYRSLQ